ncbi:MAG: hypothetical protein KDC00_07180 [Flavobacteriales bacterium]|nr:hypothetical protein [Flavobacteriales bacterium]
MRILLLSCKKAAAMIDRRGVAGLNGVQRVQLWVHLSICQGCKSFEHQSDAIDRILEHERDVDPGPRTAHLEERIIDALK